MSGTVLVTGGSGFIGGWCIIKLLDQGFTVRTTVRNLDRGPAVRATLGKIVDPQDRLSFHAAELTADGGWDAAMSGCDYLLHVASPVVIAEPKDPDELVRPARDGTHRVVGAALKAGVKRIVLTSSVAAASRRTEVADYVSDETTWTDLTDPKLSAYARSKTLAERLAWDLVQGSEGSTTMATVNPSVVLGPVLSADYSQSVQIVAQLLSGKIPAIPRLGFSIVDVRDVADLHVRAMLSPEAAGQRFIAAGKFAWMSELAELLRARLGSAARNVPTRRAPDALVRLLSLFNSELRAATPRLGKRRQFSSAKAQSVLGWVPRPLDATVLDCARSLVEVGAVRPGA
jgi:dihydroflavonol-4-reductase